MAKRKSDGQQLQDDDSSSSDTDMLDVEFEWFDPQDIDFHGLKTLLRQLFDTDHELFDLSGLSDLIISQPLLGSTVKTDDGESEAQKTDPFAFLTVLNLSTHADKACIKSLTSYLSEKAASNLSLSSLHNLLNNTTTSDGHIGLILAERFINMPVQIIPPMYKMLVEEIQWAMDAKEPYNFSHYLILSKTYTEVESKLGGDDEGGTVINEGSRPQKKMKNAKSKAATAGLSGGEKFHFHPEDEVLEKYAAASGGFEYTKQGDEGSSDARRAFQDAGVRPVGSMLLIDGTKFAEAVNAVEIFVNGNG